MPSVKTQIAVVMLSLVALTASQPARAQVGPDGAGTGLLQVSTTTDFSLSSDLSTSGFRLDLLTRFRVGMFASFSWGRGAWGRPGLLRSSTAVLRERRGLMLR